MGPFARLSIVLALVAVAASPGPAFAAGNTRYVTQAGDAGEGSFRAAVEAANANHRVERIVFAQGLRVVVASDVVYTGRQALSIFGNGSQIEGDPAAPPAPTWNGGLFASKGGANLSIASLAFLNSFNNGIGVFVPAHRAGSVSLHLHDVSVIAARFHGVFFDGQLTTGFDTDDVLHPNCVDPHPADGPASLALGVVNSTISGNGTLAGGFDVGSGFEVNGETLLTGCPADFDGVRVDDGGLGGIQGAVWHSKFEENLADGIELDERGAGGVHLTAVGSRIAANGETGTADADDGIDLDEADGGDVNAYLISVEVLGNFDEGLDFSEAGTGSVLVFLDRVDASVNEDEGFKADELDAGDLTVKVFSSRINGSLSQGGIELVEGGAGNLAALFVGAQVKENDDAGILAAQESPGVGTLKAVASDFTGNGDPSLDLTGVAAELSDTLSD